ncbi:hypothetical protein [Wolbachia endosymbiont (group B) of Limnophora tigrina]|uniref:hypothetical protein n=1 Tax=Wolbachia endosymbiont (group B) of Limnophora tigrina TaxID=3139317 RepID=UPI0035B521AC
MSNYSIKESEDNFEVTSGMSGTNRRIIKDIEVKIKPKSFEGDKQKNASVDYVHKILDKLVKDLNDTFVLNLDNILIKTFTNYTEKISTNSRDYITLKENVNNLREEVEKLKIGTSGGDNIDEWEAPTHSDIL